MKEKKLKWSENGCGWNWRELGNDCNIDISKCYVYKNNNKDTKDEGKVWKPRTTFCILGYRCRRWKCPTWTTPPLFHDTFLYAYDSYPGKHLGKRPKTQDPIDDDEGIKKIYEKDKVRKEKWEIIQNEKKGERTILS